jgi:glycosyltransferase involved in cell wall biosynthesis
MGPVVLRLLVLCDYFWPGTNAGGPIQSITAIVEELGKIHDVNVLTRNRDYASTKPYAGVIAGDDVRWRNATIRYLDRKRLFFLWLRRIVIQSGPDVVYLNSFFSPAFTFTYLFLRRLRLIPRVPVLLAPRGEFSAGALAIKATKKSVYIFVSRWIGLYEDLTWHVSSENEAADLERFMWDSYRTKLEASNIFVLPPLRGDAANGGTNFLAPEKEVGVLRVVFVSRISKMKNLVGALRTISNIDGKVVFDIYGPKEDYDYWNECESICRPMPSGCRVTYRGELDPAEVVGVIQRYDLFFLPTLGENFGHVILEALIAGRPLLISDRTRWNEIATRNAGWTIALDDQDGFRRAIEESIEMPADEFSDMAHNAWSLGRQYLLDNKLRVSDYALMFERVAGP